MQDSNRRTAPDFTNATLVMALVNLSWSFMLIWASFGFPAVLVLAVLLNHLISRIGNHRRRRHNGRKN